jgi:hypothetical protein
MQHCVLAGQHSSLQQLVSMGQQTFGPTQQRSPEGHLVPLGQTVSQQPSAQQTWVESQHWSPQHALSASQQVSSQQWLPTSQQLFWQQMLFVSQQFPSQLWVCDPVQQMVPPQPLASPPQETPPHSETMLAQTRLKQLSEQQSLSWVQVPPLPLAQLWSAQHSVPAGQVPQLPPQPSVPHCLP